MNEVSLILREKRQSLYLEPRIPSPKTTLPPAYLLDIGQSISFQIQDKVYISNTMNKVIQGLKITLSWK